MTNGVPVRAGVLLLHSDFQSSVDCTMVASQVLTYVTSRTCLYHTGLEGARDTVFVITRNWSRL